MKRDNHAGTDHTCLGGMCAYGGEGQQARRRETVLRFPRGLVGILALLFCAVALWLPAAAAALPVVTEFPICTAPKYQRNAVIDGDIVVWEDSRNGNFDIYGKDLSTGEEFPICTAATDQVNPDISGDIVVWRDSRNGYPYGVTGYDIYGKNLATGEEFSVCSMAGDQYLPAVSGDVVVWEDRRSYRYDVYGKDLASGEEFPICQNGSATDPDISGDIVVWVDGRNASPTSTAKQDIYGKELVSGDELIVCKTWGDQVKPAISGDTVVWQDARDSAGGLRVYARQLPGGTEFLMPGRNLSYDHQKNPAISGDLIVWEMDYVSTTRTDGIYARDPALGTPLLVADEFAADLPAVCGDVVVWQLDNGPTSTSVDIYGASVREPVTTYTITATAGPGGTINPSGAQAVEAGGSITFTFSPDPGYEVEQVFVDGEPQGVSAAEIFPNVTSDHTISVSFVAVVKPSFAPNPDGWQFYNGSDSDRDHGWAIWSHLFGDSPASQAAYDAEWGEEGVFNGVCYGMAASSAAYYSEMRSILTTTPWAWGPVSAGKFSGGIDPFLREEIEEFHLAQYAEWDAAPRQGEMLSEDYSTPLRAAGESYAEALTAWVDELTEALETGPQIIAMYREEAGHAVVGYRLEWVGTIDAAEARLFVYDSNAPGRDDLYITLWPEVGRWRYGSFDSLEEEDGIAFQSPRAAVDVVDHTGPVNYAHALWGVTYGVGGAAVLRDATGRVSGYPESSESGMWEVPGVTPWSVMRSTAEGVSSVAFHAPDVSALALEMTPGAGGEYRSSYTGTRGDIYVAGIWSASRAAEAASGDRLEVGEAGTTAALTPGAALAARVVLAEHQGACVAVDVPFTPSEFASAGGTLRVTLEPIPSGLALGISDEGAVNGTIFLSFPGSASHEIAVPEGAAVRVELLGGQAAGLRGVASAMTVRTDVNADGEWDSETSGTLVAPESQGEIDFSPPDLVAPITTASGVDNLWHSGEVTVTLTADDEGGSGLDYTEYSTNDGASWTKGSAATLSDEGVTALLYRSADVAGNVEETKSVEVKIDKTPPAVSLAGATIDEGGRYEQTGSFSDEVPAENSWTATVDYGDGSGFQDLALNPDKSFALTHRYTDDGTYTVTVAVSDANGLSGSATAEVAVNNLAPELGVIELPSEPLALGSPAVASVSFTDAGTLDTHTATWEWGDGTTSEAVIDEADGAGTASGEHTYASAGVYSVSVTVVDDDGGSATATATDYLVVYDPEGGFVTGAGWIDSPEGAYAADPSLTGKATFGFVSKYKKGATIPSGETQFQFKVADLNFHSSSYDWLVVAGAKAMYKGTGTVNGEGTYRFLLSAVDGGLLGGGKPDTFRIKIWDKATDAIVYDNQMEAAEDAEPTTVIGGGSIVVHK